MLAKILLFIPNLFRAIKLLGLVGDIKQFVTQTVGAIQSLKKFVNTLQGDVNTQGKQVIKELDDALEKLADICKKVPGLKGYEKRLRDLIRP